MHQDGQTLLSVLNSFTDALLVTDWQTNVVLLNDTASRLFNLNEEKAIGRPVPVLLESDELLSFFIRAMKSDGDLAKLMAGEEPVIKTKGQDRSSFTWIL